MLPLSLTAFRIFLIVCVSFLALPCVTTADVALTERFSWQGRGSIFITGATLGEDTDSDGNMNRLITAGGSFTITSSGVPENATVEKAFLYWGGSQRQVGVDPGVPDTAITLTLPNDNMVTVNADVTHSSDAASSAYDMFVSRAEITSLLAASPLGTYTVTGYSSSITDQIYDNASAALVIIYADSSIPLRHIALHDGLVTLFNNTHTLTVSNFVAANTAPGTLGYYALESDSAAGPDSVTVQGGATFSLSDGDNPAINVMNGVSNTRTPKATLETDIDLFNISPGIAAGATSLNVTYSSGANDKLWVGVNVVAVAVQPPPPPDLILTLRHSGPAEVELCWPSVTDQPYDVEHCTNLTSGTWHNLSSLSGNGNTNCVTDSISAGSAKFYRVVEP